MSHQSDHSDDEIVDQPFTSGEGENITIRTKGDSMAESSYEIIKSNFEQSGESDGSTDESVSTSELPDLVPIEPKEERKETESSPDPEDETGAFC